MNKIDQYAQFLWIAEQFPDEKNNPEGIEHE